VEVTAFIGNNITTTALQARTTAIVAMDPSITIMVRMERGEVTQVTRTRTQATAAEVSGSTGIIDREVMAGTTNRSITPLLVDVLCSSITALSLSLLRVATSRSGLKINTVRRNGKVATGMAAEGSNRGDPLLPSIITQSIT